MHKFVLGIFTKSKSFFQFLKIVDVFMILMLIILWMENLVKSEWNWINFVRPFLEGLVSAGASINDGSINLFEAVFEFKYFIALVILLLIYLLIHVAYLLLCSSENVYQTGRNKIHKIQEDAFNKKMAEEQFYQQKKLQSYIVYISAKPKNSKTAKLLNINLDEQINSMNKFLIEQTGTAPIKFDEGYVYRFFKFDNINSVLESFFKVIHSDAPLDYQVCIVLEEANKAVQDERLRNLISLGFLNKISTLSNITYRYSFVEKQKYSTSLIGLYKHGNEEIEVHEFVEQYIQF